ncbi:hypothetical protein CASFOL_033544 [Castilleja foliolosa]|uniref:Uncharacterized protein n=1 Tax=Castilleja foliolosa TaxID=1961234 RepID=A0ABD3BXB2_9LAMI
MANPPSPAISVSNIKNFIPITLEMDNSQYTSWSELFKIHCRACEVLDHLKLKESDNDASWDRIDAIVLQWIYGTISNDLLHTIIKPDSTAAQAWNALANIFQDNKTSRAVYLEHSFANTKLDNFANVSSYSQALKSLSDQLSNVGAPISNERLVLQLISGLNEQFDGVAMLLQQTTPLPEFYEARSKLILEETRKSKQASNASATADTALLSAAKKSSGPTSANSHPTPQHPPYGSDNSAQYSNNGGRGQNGRGRGRGRGKGRGRGRGNQVQYIQYSPWSYPPQRWSYPPTAAPQQWPAPPAPYPTQGPPPRGPPSTAPGLLGPRPPAQAHYSYEQANTPTDIDQAFNTMSLYPPDHNWYLDSGATTHMTNATGILRSSFLRVM